MASASPLKDVEVIYFDIEALGRGEVIRLYLHAVGVPFKDTRVPMAAWPAMKKELMDSGVNPSGYIPVVFIAGRPYVEHIATLRYIARVLGLYGKDPERDYFADAVADAHQEWVNQWVSVAFGGGEDAKARHLEEELPVQLNRFETFLARYPEGPFVCGADFTFADAALFRILHNEEKACAAKVRLPEQFPLLAKFYAAVEALPTLAAYLKSRE